MNSIVNKSLDMVENIVSFSDKSLYSFELMKSLLGDDKVVQEHSIRVKDISLRLGLYFKLEESEMQLLYTSAILHDVGKKFVPNDILYKTESLTDFDWMKIKSHPDNSYYMIKEFDQSAANIVLYHHERWDGRGYPSGLSGDKIPFLARIISIADSYDSMTKDTLYRKAISHKDALIEIKNCAGSQFDPLIVDSFLKAISD